MRDIIKYFVKRCPVIVGFIFSTRLFEPEIAAIVNWPWLVMLTLLYLVALKILHQLNWFNNVGFTLKFNESGDEVIHPYTEKSDGLNWRGNVLIILHDFLINQNYLKKKYSIGIACSYPN